MTVAEIVTNEIIEKLKQGEVAWHKSWSCNPPINYVTRKEYRGINRLLLERGKVVDAIVSSAYPTDKMQAIINILASHLIYVPSKFLLKHFLLEGFVSCQVSY